MHLVPADQAHRRVIDEDRVCEAIAAVGERDDLDEKAHRFALLSDPGRLALLTAIAAVPDITVSDLAVAAVAHHRRVMPLKSLFICSFSRWAVSTDLAAAGRPY